MPFVWNPALLIGNKQIDDQHMRIFQILDDLIRAVSEHRGNQEVGQTLSAMAMFVIAHFRMEEELMESCAFPGRDRHRVAHNEVRRQVEQFVDRFHGDGLEPTELIDFMKTWLGGHVQMEDQALADFLGGLKDATG